MLRFNTRKGLLRGAIAKGRMQTVSVVERLDVLGDGEPCPTPVPNLCRWYISFFRVAKNDSAASLSQHTAVCPTPVRTSPTWGLN